MTAPTNAQAAGRRNRNPEHTIQAFGDRFIDRVVLPPMYTTGIDAASVTTQNARARAAGRGIKFGFVDALVWQDNQRTHAIEYKHGAGQATDRQLACHASLAAVGISTTVARNIPDILYGLRRAGFRLHGNADNIAAETQARLEAALLAGSLKPARRAALRKEKPSQAGLKFSATHSRLGGLFRG